MTSPTIGDKLWGYFWDEYDVYPKTLPEDELKDFCNKKKIEYSNSLQNTLILYKMIGIIYYKKKVMIILWMN